MWIVWIAGDRLGRFYIFVYDRDFQLNEDKQPRTHTQTHLKRDNDLLAADDGEAASGSWTLAALWPVWPLAAVRLPAPSADWSACRAVEPLHDTSADKRNKNMRSRHRNRSSVCMCVCLLFARSPHMKAHEVVPVDSLRRSREDNRNCRMQNLQTTAVCCWDVAQRKYVTGVFNKSKVGVKICLVEADWSNIKPSKNLAAFHGASIYLGAFFYMQVFKYTLSAKLQHPLVTLSFQTCFIAFSKQRGSSQKNKGITCWRFLVYLPF